MCSALKPIENRERDVWDTIGSFEFQWRHIPWGVSLLSDPSFKSHVTDILPDELSLPKEWFHGKRVLDVGCGNGRWSYGLVSLGAQVVAFDTSISGCVCTRRSTRGNVDVILADALYAPFRAGQFDLVFCWGVLHHTGDTPRAFSVCAQLARRGGLMHVYLYGPKSRRTRLLRKLLRPFSYDGRYAILKVLTSVVYKLGRLGHLLRHILPLGPSLHGNFDAYSTQVNDELRSDQVRAQFRKQGFMDITELHPTWCGLSRDIHMRGKREWAD